MRDAQGKRQRYRRYPDCGRARGCPSSAARPSVQRRLSLRVTRIDSGAQDPTHQSRLRRRLYAPGGLPSLIKLRSVPVEQRLNLEAVEKSRRLTSIPIQHAVRADRIRHPLQRGSEPHGFRRGHNRNRLAHWSFCFAPIAESDLSTSGIIFQRVATMAAQDRTPRGTNRTTRIASGGRLCVHRVRRRRTAAQPQQRTRRHRWHPALAHARARSPADETLTRLCWLRGYPAKCLKKWRPRPELNRSTRFCRPLRNHSATWPHGPTCYRSSRI